MKLDHEGRTRSLRRTTLATLTVVTALLGPLVACGGSNDSAAGGRTIKIGLAVPGPTSAEPLLAESLGYFEDHGVNVDLVSLGTTAATQAAAGRVDLAVQGCTSALPPAVAGRQTRIAYLLAGNGTGVSIAANSSLKAQATPEESLLQLAGKRVAITGVAGNSAGMARAISSLLESKGLAPLTLVNLSDAGAVSAQVLTGQVDAYVGPSEVLGGAIAAGKATQLIAQNDPVLDSLGGGNSVAGVCAWGLAAGLDREGDAVKSVIAALRDASKYIQSHQPAEIAMELRKYPDLQSQDVDVLTEIVKIVLPSKLGIDGSISEEMWQRSLDTYAKWGFDIDMTSDPLQYDRIIDMEYLG